MYQQGATVFCWRSGVRESLSQTERIARGRYSSGDHGDSIGCEAAAHHLAPPGTQVGLDALTRLGKDADLALRPIIEAVEQRAGRSTLDQASWPASSRSSMPAMRDTASAWSPVATSSGVADRH